MADAVGYAAAGAAAVIVGSAFVPTKLYPTYDGMIFQWFMCSGIMGVGVVWGVLSNHWEGPLTATGLYVFPHGIIGGAGWALANAMIPTVVNFIGLSKGFIFWNSTKMLVCAVVQTFGFYGLTPRPPSNWFIFLLGMALILVAIGVFGVVKPTLSKVAAQKAKNLGSETPESLHTELTRTYGATPSLGDDTGRRRTSSSTTGPHAIDVLSELPNFGPYEINGLVPPPKTDDEDEAAAHRRFLIGSSLAVLVGFIFGNTMTPFLIWQEQCQAFAERAAEAGVTVTCKPTDMIFSQCLGDYLGSTLVFVVYSMVHKYRGTTMRRSAMRPAYIAGMLWSLGKIIQFAALQTLPFIVVYPVMAIGPAAVSTLWSTFYFGEIQGARNMRLLALGCTLAFVGIILNTLSHPH